MSRAVLLLAYGGPERLDQVEAYYTAIRRGSPPPGRLLDALIGRYAAIGGGSPLSRIVEDQRAALERELERRGDPVRVYAGMRHITPFIGEVVARMAADGVDEAVAIALAPHASSTSTGAYRRALDAATSALGPGGPVVAFVESWHTQPRFLEALAAATEEALALTADRAGAQLVFTAHSLPLRALAGGDPYPVQLAETARLVAARVGRDAFTIAYQSAGRTDEPWLGPDLRDEIRRLAAGGVREVVVNPIGFVADHLEVLYDIDIEAAAVARELGIHLVRARALNDDPTFIAGLADLVATGRPVATA